MPDLSKDVSITVLGKRLIYVFFWEGTHDDTYCSIGEALGYRPTEEAPDGNEL